MGTSPTFRGTGITARDAIARGLLILGGCVLLLESLFGILAILIYVYRTILDVTTALCLILPFPLYLVGLKSLRVAIWLLWIYFLAQWGNECLVSVPPQLVNPFEPHGIPLFASIASVQIGYLILSYGSRKGTAVNLYNSFATTK